MWPILPKNERNFATFQFYHGVGDKRYKVGIENEYPPMFDHWDYWMLPGEKDCQKLLYHSKIAGITLSDEQIVKIGYLRFDKYINGDYNVTELKKLAGIPDNGRKNILFSPTWRWGGGTLMSHYKTFCDLIPQKYNLIIRNHINDANKLSEIREYCRGKKIKNVYFLNDTIMNINDNMTFADLLISDSSSVLYDFLITGRPIIFNKISSPNVMKSEYRFDIKRCGFEFIIGSQNILNVIEKSLTTDQFQSHIDEVRQNCFYFLDGKSTERAIDFINSVVKKE
ncbi:MAG: CDP-glycerol glycerophosphotransferase family protein [Candidatus Marinimicrobia bacterium]|nr:CDP-glycerol glycerophosphotransferase family protein [Candidatus Neomarinimicrobiota bacterium]